jgi:hypothetical protein
MGSISGGMKVVREDSSGKRHVTLCLSQLAYEAVMGEEVDSPLQARMERAVGFYLGDKGSRPAWAYPGFLRGSEAPAGVSVDFDVDEALWNAFEEEAATQSVTVGQLAEHAAFYFAAGGDAGRLAERILEATQGDKEG